MIKYLSMIFLLLSILSFPQEKEMIVVIGDSLIGRVENGESIREVSGNVILTQGNVRITCTRAIQYLSRNDAELIGNVVATQNTLTIKTERGFYYGNLRKTSSNSGVILDDKKVILTADAGEYFFDENKAVFQSNVKLFDTASTLTSQQLTYLRNEDRAIATNNVKIIDSANTIFADTIDHFRKTQITFASGNVVIKNNENNFLLFGEHLEDYRQDKYTVIDKLPMLVQVDSSKSIDSLGFETIRLDTLFIQCKVMEVYREPVQKFIATDSVIIIRDLFSSKNDMTVYLKDEEKIITKKISDEHKQPVLWYDNSQLTGDSITIYISDKKIRELDVDGNAFMVSQNKNFNQRFDQSSASGIKMFFEDNKIQRAEFFGNVYSIYYLYDDEQPNGLMKTNSKDAVILFEDNQVSEVKLYGSPGSEYYPEQQVNGNEKSYLLPKFIFINERPDKQKMYEQLNRIKWQLH
ncbi:MAG: OstA-like protein [Ignavibacterium sp.]|uniref:OstA-like protein n=1 Tax=Ignavibacterium sp. TaxID=2651167 RepID=UPI00404B9D13